MNAQDEFKTLKKVASSATLSCFIMEMNGGPMAIMGGATIGYLIGHSLMGLILSNN